MCGEGALVRCSRRRAEGGQKKQTHRIEKKKTMIRRATSPAGAASTRGATCSSAHPHLGLPRLPRQAPVNRWSQALGTHPPGLRELTTLIHVSLLHPWMRLLLPPPRTPDPSRTPSEAQTALSIFLAANSSGSISRDARVSRAPLAWSSHFLRGHI